MTAQATSPAATLELAQLFIELCDQGLLTCTHGQPGSTGASYALAWLPMENAELHSAEVQRQHAANMRRFKSSDDTLTSSELLQIEQLCAEGKQ